MKISKIQLTKFRRFTQLTIEDLPESAKLIVLVGPNGSGKSSFFDALQLWSQLNSNFGWSGDSSYYAKSNDSSVGVHQRVALWVHGDADAVKRGSFYFRSAYRNDPEFQSSSLSRHGPPEDEIRFRRMIEGDATVSQNYQRLASKAMEGVFSANDDNSTVGAFRASLIGEIAMPLQRVLPDLTLTGLGNPVENGTFRFTKGAARDFEYKNLSGGEKAAFDLILDLVVKRGSFRDAVYCIDEPEAHMNSKLQGDLLEQLVGLVPSGSQLWIASHSIGMMRRALELHRRDPASVAFLDFGGADFDEPVILRPVEPNREFWNGVLSVALDDLASLVAPSRIVICEGNPAGAIPGKNSAHDAQCYNRIFSTREPDATFISAGNSHEVQRDRLGLAAALPLIAPGIGVVRLIDRDDHAPEDVARFRGDGIHVLSRRHLESYLYDDEVLAALCAAEGKPELLPDVLRAKASAISQIVGQGKPADDIKSCAGLLYTSLKSLLGLTAAGNDAQAFARNTLAKHLTPDLAVYRELHGCVF